MTDLDKLPEFKALERVHGALKPLKPEGRRRVIEAIHTLLEIGEGTPSSQGRKGPGPGKFQGKKSRR